MGLYKIVVADDEAKIREGLVNLFPWNNLGFEVVADFSNGHEVLDYLDMHKDVDVVLTDIQMPDIDGIKLSEALLEKETRVIFFSSYQEFAYAKAAITNHVFEYLTKPIKYEDLVSCFNRLRSILDKEIESKDSSTHKSTPVFTTPTDKKDLVKKVLNYVDNNYRSCSLEEAAGDVFMSPSYLSTIFSKETGSTFSEYLQKVRMEHACDMLQDPSIKQYQIASLVGYDNPKNFSRAFKAYFGISPQDYRAGKLHKTEDSSL